MINTEDTMYSIQLKDSNKISANVITYRVSSSVWWGIFWKISWIIDNVPPTDEFLKDKVFRLR